MTIKSKKKAIGIIYHRRNLQAPDKEQSTWSARNDI